MFGIGTLTLEITNTANPNVTQQCIVSKILPIEASRLYTFCCCNFYLLGHFEDSQQPQGSETRKTEGTGPLLKVDPKDFKNGSSDDGKVKAVEGGGEVNKDS